MTGPARRRRYVLRYQGEGAKPSGDAARVRELPGVTVVDESPRMLLVEGDEASLARLAETFPGWTVAPQQTYSIPDSSRGAPGTDREAGG